MTGSKRKSEGETYIPNFTASEVAASTSDDVSTLDYQLKRGYSDSMMNAMEQVLLRVKSSSIDILYYLIGSTQL